jgi:hypothetical protein
MRLASLEPAGEEPMIQVKFGRPGRGSDPNLRLTARGG